MYTFIRGCLRYFLCRANTPLHPSVTSSRHDRLFSFISYKTLVRFRHYSESLSFHSFKRPLPSHSRLNAHHSRRSHFTNPYPHTVIFHCVICFIRSNLPRGVLPSQPISHTVQASFAFTFSMVLNAVVFRCIIRHECVPWSPYSPRYLCAYLAHIVTTIASASPEFFQLLLVAILLPGLMYGRAIKSI